MMLLAGGRAQRTLSVAFIHHIGSIILYGHGRMQFLTRARRPAACPVLNLINDARTSSYLINDRSWRGCAITYMLTNDVITRMNDMYAQ